MECDLVGVLRFFFRCLLSWRPSGTEGSFFKSHPTPALPLHLPLHFHNFYRRCPHYRISPARTKHVIVAFTRVGEAQSSLPAGTSGKAVCDL